MLALPVARRGGSIELLRPYLNVSDNEYRPTIAWLAMALFPVGPYPILSLHSEQGSALTEKVGRKVARSAAWPKTTRSLMSELRRLAPQLRIHGLSIRFGRSREGVVISFVTAGFLACVGEFGQEGDSNAFKAS